MTRVRATLTLDDDELLIETNSERRMDSVLSDLTSVVPDLAIDRQTRRPAADLQEVLHRSPAPTDGPGLDPSDPNVAAVLEQVVRQHEEAWLGEPIPALSGVTPREAAADPTRRPDLIKLLGSFPPASPTVPGMMDPDRLRAALDLS